MKAILVSKCEQCPYYLPPAMISGSGAVYCCWAHKYFAHAGVIPDWCPLDDAPMPANCCGASGLSGQTKGAA